jgi:hypothetical protein
VSSAFGKWLSADESSKAAQPARWRTSTPSTNGATTTRQPGAVVAREAPSGTPMRDKSERYVP